MKYLIVLFVNLLLVGCANKIYIPYGQYTSVNENNTIRMVLEPKSCKIIFPSKTGSSFAKCIIKRKSLGYDDFSIRNPDGEWEGFGLFWFNDETSEVVLVVEQSRFAAKTPIVTFTFLRTLNLEGSLKESKENHYERLRKT